MPKWQKSSTADYRNYQAAQNKTAQPFSAKVFRTEIALGIALKTDFSAPVEMTKPVFLQLY
jgi:hypothetical protein